MREAAIECIVQYIADLRVPTNSLRKAKFKQDSYSLWAAYEILHRVETCRDRRPIEIVDDFRQEMDELACENHHTSWIFSVAYDVAEDILYQMV
jgi:hypothetical protein